MAVGYTYILLCSNDTYYVGSTKYLEQRYQQHCDGVGSNHTRKFPPVKLLYYEEFQHIGLAFAREHQIKGWSRRKKEALMAGDEQLLSKYARSYMYHGHPK